MWLRGSGKNALKKRRKNVTLPGIKTQIIFFCSNPNESKSENTKVRSFDNNRHYQTNFGDRNKKKPITNQPPCVPKTSQESIPNPKSKKPNRKQPYYLCNLIFSHNSSMSPFSTRPEKISTPISNNTTMHRQQHSRSSVNNNRNHSTTTSNAFSTSCSRAKNTWSAATSIQTRLRSFCWVWTRRRPLNPRAIDHGARSVRPGRRRRD